jgi:hypothetical protein
MIPTKPIESATIYFPGELAAGLRATSFKAEVWIDPSSFDEGQVPAWLEEIRSKIREAYEVIMGEPPSVLFDFEIAEQAAQEEKYEAMMGTPHGHETEKDTENP